ncbi:TPA: hypothetical protein KD091_004630 [Vibrio parahaemolyticus]|jgi:hypothetical protein|nr:hypothetical protein [Vibrio parahaemolyticus]
MDINKLLDDTKNSITEQLSSNTQTKQSIICSNLENIEALSSNGVSYRKLLELCNISIELKHFHDLIYRAKKKRADTQANASTANAEKTKVMPVKASPQQPPKKENRAISALDASHDEETKQKQTQHEVNPKIISHFSEADWKAIGINNDYLISVLLETDLSPDEVKSWNCPNQIQLSTRISEYRHRKMKRK